VSAPGFHAPPQVPRTRNAFGRWLGRLVLRLGGWKVVGDWPDVPRLMIIVAPHSSAWDAVWGLAAKLAFELDVRFMAKAELFRGPLGWLLRRFGAEAVDRSRPGGTVGQASQRLREAPRLWLVIAPEGTRKRVEHWKRGFWHIARTAEVPVLCVYFHYPERTIGIGPLLEMGADMEADMQRVRAIYRPYVGKRRGTL
jgi:1-acyl-sn-glycerol-3-phosphate acyltransferase